VFADVDDTIRQLLIDHVPLDLAEVDVSFDAPDREWSARLSRPTVNCFLYDVRQNVERRDAEWSVTRDMRTNVVTRRQGPLRIDATYYVTVWARMPEDEHRLLWRVLSVLARFPVVPQGVLAGELQEQPYPLQARVAQPGEQHTSATDLWQALDNRVRPSLSYVLTLALDPQVEFESPVVLTRIARVRTTVNGMGGSEEFVHPPGANGANQQEVEDGNQPKTSRASKRRAKS
jgi:Pvc16 N-terminal domain